MSSRHIIINRYRLSGLKCCASKPTLKCEEVGLNHKRLISDNEDATLGQFFNNYYI